MKCVLPFATDLDDTPPKTEGADKLMEQLSKFTRLLQKGVYPPIRESPDGSGSGRRGYADVVRSRETLGHRNEGAKAVEDRRDQARRSASRSATSRAEGGRSIRTERAVGPVGWMVMVQQRSGRSPRTRSAHSTRETPLSQYSTTPR